jgi:uncharacterized membrane protein
MEKSDQRPYGQILAILLIFYGSFQLLAAAFFGGLLWAISGGYVYYEVLKAPGGFAFFGVLILVLLLPFLVAYALLKKTGWAKGAVLLMSVIGLSTSFMLLLLLSQPRWSTNRVIVMILVGGTITSLSLYGGWFATRHDV